VRGRRALPLVLAVALLGATACERASRDENTARRSATAQVAATVDGVPITLDEVRWLVAETGLTPRDALARLIDEQLLVQRAEARGYGKGAQLARELTRARVRALLAHEVEAPVPADDVAGRAARLAQLLEGLRRRTEVRYLEPAIARAISRDDLR